MSRGTSVRNLESERFHKYGFTILENILSPADCDRILSVVENSNAPRGRGGVRNLMAVAGIDALANDLRLIDLTHRVTGKRLVPFKATLFLKTGKANWLVSWHQDTALPVQAAPCASGWGPTSVKATIKFSHAPTAALSKILALRIQLDESVPSNGPLRVIPGSHRRRYAIDSELSDMIASTKETVCNCGKGGVIAMRPLIVHASSKAITDMPRRVLHLEYAESLQITPSVRLAIA